MYRIIKEIVEKIDIDERKKLIKEKMEFHFMDVS